MEARRVPGFLPYIVAATFFMEYLDTTIIATALPQMAKSFGVGPNEVSLGMTAYMLTLAVFIPVSGWVADRFGSRTVFGGAIIIFVAASVMCGFSNGIAWFTAARVLQGLGGAMMVPVGRMIVVRNTEKSQMMKAISTITWPAIVAPVLGPSVGGFITTYASWHWIFFINVPFGICAFAAIMRFVPNQREVTRRKLDVAGFLLTGATLILILYGTELASQQNARLGYAAGCVVAGLLLGVVAIRHAGTAKQPLIDLSTLKVPTFSVTVMSGSATRIGIEAVPYLLPLMFQLGFGLTPFRSGLLMLASALGNLSMKSFTTRILRRFGFRTVAIYNVVICAVFMAICGWLTPAMPVVIILAVLLVHGLTRSMQFTTLATLAYADVNETQKVSASVLWSVAQQMTIGLGIAFGALSLRVFSGLFPVAGGGFALVDFRGAFGAAAVLTGLSVIGYLRLAKSAGDSIGRVPVAAKKAVDAPVG